MGFLRLDKFPGTAHLARIPSGCQRHGRPVDVSMPAFQPGTARTRSLARALKKFPVVDSFAVQMAPISRPTSGWVCSTCGVSRYPQHTHTRATPEACAIETDTLREACVRAQCAELALASESSQGPMGRLLTRVTAQPTLDARGPRLAALPDTFCASHTPQQAQHLRLGAVTVTQNRSC